MSFPSCGDELEREMYYALYWSRIERGFWKSVILRLEDSGRMDSGSGLAELFAELDNSYTDTPR